MKLIEALKGVQDLQRKADDLCKKVNVSAAHLSYETPAYPNQRKQVSQWIQAYGDILKEILRLRVAIQKTNIETQVVITLGGNDVTKSIAEWIHRRRDLAKSEANMWRNLQDRGLKESIVNQSTGEKMEIKIIRCYDPVERDNKIIALDEEPSKIDAKLEIANAVIDLV